MNVKIEKIISSGDGIGWTDGKTYFAPYTVPGELINIISCRKDRSFYRVDQFELISSSSDRRIPVCDNFTRCGGCMFLHINYARQLNIKKDIFQELCKKNKLEITHKITLNSIGEYHTRTRAKVRILDGRPGFNKRFSHTFIPFEKCPLLHEELNQIIQTDAPKKRDGEYQYEYATETGAWLPDKTAIFKNVKDTSLKVSRGSFFQSSEKAAASLVTFIEKKIREYPPERVVDLFCGIGLFSTFVKKLDIHVLGVESNSIAIKDFKENCPAVKIINADANKFHSFRKNDLVIVDPPREGLDKQLISAFGESYLSRIIYISCGPSTFVRDVKRLESYGFSIAEIKLNDLFPVTQHFEICAYLKR